MWDLIVSVPDHCLSFYFESTGVSKILGNGLILPVPPAKQQELLSKAGPYLTNAHINQMLKSNNITEISPYKSNPRFAPTYSKNGRNLGLVLEMKNIACISILLTKHVKYLYLFKFVLYSIVAFKAN